MRYFIARASAPKALTIVFARRKMLAPGSDDIFVKGEWATMDKLGRVKTNAEFLKRRQKQLWWKRSQMSERILIDFMVEVDKPEFKMFLLKK